MVERAAQRVERLVEALQRPDGPAVESSGRDGQHRDVDEARDAHRDDDVPTLEAKDLFLLLGGRAHHAALRERRVQVDDVRHHGGAEDAGAKQDAFGAVEARDEQAARNA